MEKQIILDQIAADLRSPDEAVRLNAVNELITLKQSLLDLAKPLLADSPPISEKALEVLNFDIRSVVEAFISVMQKTEDTEMRQRIIIHVSPWRLASARARCIDFMFSLVGNASEMELGAIFDQIEYASLFRLHTQLEEIISKLSSEIAAERRVAVAMLKHYREDRAAMALAQSLRDTDEPVRYQAALALPYVMQNIIQDVIYDNKELRTFVMTQIEQAFFAFYDEVFLIRLGQVVKYIEPYPVEFWTRLAQTNDLFHFEMCIDGLASLSGVFPPQEILDGLTALLDYPTAQDVRIRYRLNQAIEGIMQHGDTLFEQISQLRPFRRPIG